MDYSDCGTGTWINCYEQSWTLDIGFLGQLFLLIVGLELKLCWIIWTHWIVIVHLISLLILWFTVSKHCYCWAENSSPRFGFTNHDYPKLGSVHFHVNHVSVWGFPGLITQYKFFRHVMSVQLNLGKIWQLFAWKFWLAAWWKWIWDCSGIMPLLWWKMMLSDNKLWSWVSCDVIRVFYSMWIKLTCFPRNTFLEVFPPRHHDSPIASVVFYQHCSVTWRKIQHRNAICIQHYLHNHGPHFKVESNGIVVMNDIGSG